MSKAEINYTLAQINENLFASMPGKGTTEERRAARDAANKMVVTLPKAWYRKADKDLSAQFLTLGAA